MSTGTPKERYVEELKHIDYDMMVVDEIHKMKTLKGERTKQLMELTKRIDGGNKYLALLSGTPAPNKVQDITIILKLLHPDKFDGMTDKELVTNIIKGDLIDLRSLLLPYMQMKSLEEGVEMPPLHEALIETELSTLEKEVYEVLIEDDELTALEKMRILRQFVLNPKLV